MKRMILLGVMALAAGCAGPGSNTDPDTASRGADVADADPGLASPIEIEGVGNFAQISKGVWRGQQPTAEGFATLKKMGVKTIVNLRWSHDDRELMRGLGLNYVSIRCTAFLAEDEDVAAWLKVATDPKLRPVFVHCQHGSDRTGVAIASYRYVAQGWPMSRAIRELPRFGFHEIFGGLRDYLNGLRAERIMEMMTKMDPDVEVVP